MLSSCLSFFSLLRGRLSILEGCPFVSSPPPPPCSAVSLCRGRLSLSEEIQEFLGRYLLFSHALLWSLLFVFLEGAAVNPGGLRSRVLSSSSLLSCISLWGGAAVPLGRNPRILGQLPPSLSPSPLQDVSLFFCYWGGGCQPWTMGSAFVWVDVIT